MDMNQISSLVLQASIKVHKELGPGLLETVYQRCLILELEKQALRVKAEVPVPIHYCGQKVHKEGFRIDILVENTVVVELKSVETIKKVHKKQLLTYLRLANKPLGLLINFNESLLMEGVTRIIN